MEHINLAAEIMTEAEKLHLRHKQGTLDGTGTQEEMMNSTEDSQESRVRHFDRLELRVILVIWKCTLCFIDSTCVWYRAAFT